MLSAPCSPNIPISTRHCDKVYYSYYTRCAWDGYTEHCSLSHVRNRSPNTVIVTSVAARNDVAVISWDSLQKGHRKDARSQERRLRRETLSTQAFYKKPALADRQCNYTVRHQVVLLLTTENEKDSVENTLSMTIYVLREAGSRSQ